MQNLMAGTLNSLYFLSFMIYALWEAPLTSLATQILLFNSAIGLFFHFLKGKGGG